MRFTHTKCGGEIDVAKRQCRRCKKKWNPVAFRVDALSIRPMVDTRGKLVPDKVPHKLPKQKTKSHADWVEGVPVWLDLGITRLFVKKLPRWPRWARILTTLAFVGVVVVIVITLGRC